MEYLIRRADVVRPMLKKYQEEKRNATKAWELNDLALCHGFRSSMETLRVCIQIAVEAPAVEEAGGAVLLDALEHYGERAQVDMMLEEMAELSKALLKLRRAQKFREPGQRLLMEDVAEEIADVQIVLDQMKLLFPGWETWMQKKLQRLEERIEKERTKGAVKRRDAGDRAAAAGGDGPAVRRPPGDGGSGEAGPVQGESEAST
mgnify:CR=1 FL=1